ncbi:MAG: RcpC/CpaB family pilus assembly protein [Actinomycetota bacterium]
MRVVVGVTLMLFAIAGTTSLVRRAQDRTPVLVAARQVEPGHVIEPSDLRVADISLPRGVAYLPASGQGRVVGQIATEALWPGKILGPRSIARSSTLPAGQVSMSVALKPHRCSAGDLRAGDHVAVISSPTPDRNLPTTILFTDVTVQSVRQAQTSEGSALVVALRLRLEEARALAEAQAKGSINLVLLSRDGQR